MDIVYLKDGTQCNLIKKIDDQFLVDPYIIIYGYEGEEDNEPSGNLRVVSEVYDKAPIELIDAEYRAALAKIKEQENKLAEKRTELNKLQAELKTLEGQKTDISKGVINRRDFRNAKRLIVFEKDNISPCIMDAKNNLKLTISYTISQYESEEKVWVYNMYYGEWTNSNYYDAEYGVFFDLTDEEILQLTHDRQLKKKNTFSEAVISRTNDKWLTPEFIDKKIGYLEKGRVQALRNATERLEQAQKDIEKYSLPEASTA